MFSVNYLGMSSTSIVAIIRLALQIPDEDHEDDEYTPGSKKAKKQKPKKRKADSDDDSDEDWGKKKKVSVPIIWSLSFSCTSKIRR